jgi:hypothetical protein
LLGRPAGEIACDHFELCFGDFAAIERAMQRCEYACDAVVYLLRCEFGHRLSSFG